jgi:4-hydroxyphenylacetate 3-monooxygenase
MNWARRDFFNPEIRPYIDRHMRGSNSYTAERRIKLMKLLWDCTGTEFGGAPRALRDQLQRHQEIRR